MDYLAMTSVSIITYGITIPTSPFDFTNLSKYTKPLTSLVFKRFGSKILLFSP